MVNYLHFLDFFGFVSFLFYFEVLLWCVMLLFISALCVISHPSVLTSVLIVNNVHVHSLPSSTVRLLCFPKSVLCLPTVCSWLIFPCVITALCFVLLLVPGFLQFCFLPFCLISNFDFIDFGYQLYFSKAHFLSLTWQLVCCLGTNLCEFWQRDELVSLVTSTIGLKVIYFQQHYLLNKSNYTLRISTWLDLSTMCEKCP